MNKLELMSDLDARISAAKVKGFWSDAQKLVWLNDAGRRVCSWRSPYLPGFLRWPFLELAMETVSRSSKEYYDVPPNMKVGSIYQVDVEGESEARDGVVWEVYQKHKQNDDDVQVFANHEDYYFLHTIPEDGKTISVYGERKWVPLVNDTDTPITPESLDEAIVRITLASCLRKAQKRDAAAQELSEVIDPQNGLIMMVAQLFVTGGEKGYVGQARSTRW